MQKVAFTCCKHLYHKKMPKTRGFPSVEEMNEKLIEQHNSVVKDDWDVIDFGDVHLGNPNSVAPLIKRLNGRKILILGNHDTPKNINKLKHLYDEVHDGYIERQFHVDGSPVLFCMSHYPMASWNGQYRGSIHLHGHCHNRGVNAFHPHKIDISVDKCVVNEQGEKEYTLMPPWTLQDIQDAVLEAKKRSYTWLVKMHNSKTKHDNFLEIVSKEYEISKFLKELDAKLLADFEEVKYMSQFFRDSVNPEFYKPAYHTKVDGTQSAWRGDL